MGKVRYPFALVMAILLLMFSSAEGYLQKKVYASQEELVTTSLDQECVNVSSYLPFQLVKLTLIFTLTVFASALLVLAAKDHTVSLSQTRAPDHICPQLSLIPFPNAP